MWSSKFVVAWSSACVMLVFGILMAGQYFEDDDLTLFGSEK